MIDQLKRNTIFYVLSVVFILMSLIIMGWIDFGDEVLYFGKDRSESWDIFFKYITRFGEEFTYFIIFAVLLFIQFRYAIFVPVIGLLVTLVSYGLKSVFRHERPAVFFRDSDHWDLIEKVDGIPLLQGLTSFPSGHTLSAFCIFGFLAYVLHKYEFARILQFTCFVLAALVGISRIYLFQHFLKDVAFGAFLGTLLAIVCVALAELPSTAPDRWFNKSLPLFRSKARV